MKKRTFSNPDSAEREYTRDLLRLSRDCASTVRQSIIPRVAEIVASYRSETRSDGWNETIDNIIAEVLRITLNLAGLSINRLPGRFEVVSRFNRVQFKAVVKANTGVDLPDLTAPRSALAINLYEGEPKLQAMAAGWISENTRLIKSIPEKMMGDIEGVLRRGIMQGKSVKALQDEIRARFPVSESKAKLIAQDQTLKLNGMLTEARLKSVGVTKYIWRTVRDNRVRHSHAEREGKEFSFDNPPPDGNPGQPIRDRCRAEAIWPE